MIVALLACAPAEPPITAVTLGDDNNYRYMADLSVATATLGAEADATIDWRALTRDIRGAALDPAALDEARLVAFRNLGPDAITDGLTHDSLAQADVGVYVTCAPTDASCSLSDFAMFGNLLDIQQYFIAGYGTWLLAAGHHGEPGADALLFLAADDASDVHTASITDTSARLDAEVDLRSLTPVRVAPGIAGITVDWSGLTRTGLGDPLTKGTIDTLFVGRFAESPAELETDVFGLEARAEATWSVPVDGRNAADLAELGGDFTGIDDDSTWLLSLACATCANPAPRFLTVLAAQ